MKSLIRGHDGNNVRRAVASVTGKPVAPNVKALKKKVDHQGTAIRV